MFDNGKLLGALITAVCTTTFEAVTLYACWRILATKFGLPALSLPEVTVLMLGLWLITGKLKVEMGK